MLHYFPAPVLLPSKQSLIPLPVKGLCFFRHFSGLDCKSTIFIRSFCLKITFLPKSEVQFKMIID